MNNRLHHTDLVGTRIVAVHAHPDDEALWTGGLLANLSRRGATVWVVTCTLGEQGEVIGDTYSHLVADHADQLGGFRIGELHASLALLNARGIFLGGAGYWRDSGMVGDAANNHPQAFIHSGDQAAAQLRTIVADIQPDVLITYGPDGGYGHPDHIRAHEITHQAAGEIPVLWAVTDKNRLEEGLSVIVPPQGWRAAKPGDIACVEHSDLEIRLDDVDLAAKIAAMKAHPTQLWIADGSSCETREQAAFAAFCDPERAPATFCLSNMIAQPVMRFEHYQFGGNYDQGMKKALAGIVCGPDSDNHHCAHNQPCEVLPRG
ncbi:MAG: N-acetyl-1-D-myo-inositol-2-amino-2-deoxy-alpha-D-glucopyranoside deacetylase [Corynebacterium sp.]|uniref:N-acetyl-1-D-myo-inositol-2-amino-2-deoxy-alpha- D-glucopyranoside deacetylase n=1 Tax=Corynebacterium sp. TaxID=1720 RepID=UPI0026DBE4C9|nr:N-acetyl-1-D-myo-inositol-2-amino-2-deoxy-alpha-D-glucopyranoside deacetylase [Corynebacterium sp.]MDO4761313.1 N-acetyl-1-D-myo-inositol-2-amino-2-deoxy-alpha-D-glucopyranoside deacetylase [Corynebacterium sp.]